MSKLEPMKMDMKKTPCIDFLAFSLCCLVRHLFVLQDVFSIPYNIFHQFFMNRVHLQCVIDNRKAMLFKEQAMAYARAIVVGFYP